MDTKSMTAQAPTEAGKPSRLPAGSTLIVNGIHVPHPHAEVNLAGAGDPRLGNTNAITEFVEHQQDEAGTRTAVVKRIPLPDAIKASSSDAGRGN